MNPIVVFNKNQFCTRFVVHITLFGPSVNRFIFIEFVSARKALNIGRYTHRLDCCWKIDGYGVDSQLFGDVCFYCLIGFSSENSYGDVASSSASDAYDYSYVSGYAIWNLQNCSKINHMLHINTYFYWFKEKSSSSISVQDRLLRVRLCERDRNAGGSGGFSVVSTCSARRKFPINMLFTLGNVSNFNLKKIFSDFLYQIYREQMDQLVVDVVQLVWPFHISMPNMQETRVPKMSHHKPHA